MKLSWICGAFASVVMLHSVGAAASFKHGAEEITSSGTWIAPKGVKAVQIEMWGGGGGGGVGAAGPTGASGGGGGGGAYVRGWIAVKPNQSYSITIGSGGNAGTSVTAAGAGTATEIRDAENSLLVSAPGGDAGTSATQGIPSTPGTPGAGGVPEDYPNLLERAGHSGGAGSTGFIITAGQIDNHVQGSVETAEPSITQAAPGSGGSGGGSFISTDSFAGGRGHLIISW